MTAQASSLSVQPFDWVDDIIFMLDAQLRFTFVNAFALNAWNTHQGELLGQPYQKVFPTKAAQNVIEAFHLALTTRQRTEIETYGLRHRAWINVTIHPHQGGLIVQAKPLLRTAGTTLPADLDALTGCLTRAAFQHIVDTFPLPYVLAIVDLNLLKNVNTLHGHTGGDTHIRTIAHALQQALPAEALMCRWGGDEFVIVVPGPDQAALQTLLQETNEVLPSPTPGMLAFSVGMAVREQGTPYERAFALADEQLQLHKDHLRQANPTDQDATDHRSNSFVNFSQELERLQDPSDLIQHALDRLLKLLNFDQTAYAVIEGNSTYFTHLACRAHMAYPEPMLNHRLTLPTTGLIGTVCRTRSTAWSTDYPGAMNNLPILVTLGIKSAIVTPVFSQGQVAGVIVLYALHRWQTITPQMRKIVELTALRLEHALELRRVVGELSSTLEASLLTLSIVLEARDFETHGHTTRAATMAMQLGEHLGLDSAALQLLRQGAYLHDIGKLRIPDEILQKPGRLTPEEWTRMQSHVMEGYDIAHRIPGLPPAILDVIRSHHEHWDGLGYPDALAGTDIPLSARIFAVCDVYDALISDRPYKTAWTREEAIAEIERQSGRHFDPEVVHAFLKLMERRVDAQSQADTSNN